MLNELLLQFAEVLLRNILIYLPNIVDLAFVYLFDYHVLLRGSIVTVLVVGNIVNAVLLV